MEYGHPEQMKIVLQRVKKACVSVEDRVVGRIDNGLLLFIGLAVGDTAAMFPAIVEKIVNLRVFSNNDGRFDLSVKDVDGEILLVSQFTLLAETKKGRRPDFAQAMPPEQAKILFQKFVESFPAAGFHRIACGEFGAHMNVALENDGPVTIILP